VFEVAEDRILEADGKAPDACVGGAADLDQALFF
jgi:hypothetical protein